MAKGTANISTTTLEEFGDSIVIPVNKLDAEHYMADDLDGVTESVFGSGNMSYAALQAAQTDIALAASGEDVMAQESFSAAAAIATQGGGSGIREIGSGSGDYDTGRPSREETAANTDRDLAQVETLQVAPGQGADNFTVSTASTVSASHSGTLLSDSRFSEQTTAATNGNNGNDGNNGTPGRDGVDGRDGTGDDDGDDDDDNNNDTENDTDINAQADINLTEVLNQVNELLQVAGNTVTQVTQVVTTVTQVLDDLTGDLLEGANINVNDVVALFNGLTDTLNQTTTDTVEQLLDLKNDVADALVSVLQGNGTVGDAVEAVLQPVGEVLATPAIADVLGLTQQVTELAGLDVLDGALGALGNATQTLQQELSGAIGDLSGSVSALTEAQSLSDAVGELAAVTDSVTTVVDEAVGGVLEELGLEDANLPIEQVTELTEDVQAALAETAEILDAVAAEPLEAAQEIVQNPTEAVETVTELLAETTQVDTETLDELAETLTALLDETTGGATEEISQQLVTAVDEATDGLDPVVEPILATVEEATAPVQEAVADATENFAAVTETAEAVLPGAMELVAPVEEIVNGLVDESALSGLDSLGDVTGTLEETLGTLAEDGTTGVVEAVAESVNDGITAALPEALADTVGALEGLTESGLSDILGAEENMLDPLEDVIGDVDTALGISLTPLGGETDNAAGDEDLTLLSDLNGMGEDTTVLNLDIPLDPLEAIVGDLDLNPVAALDGMGEQADDILDNGAGGSGEDNLLAQLGDTLSDTVEQATAPVMEPLQEVIPDEMAVDDEILGGINDALEEATTGLGDTDDIIGTVTSAIAPATEEISGVVEGLLGGLNTAPPEQDAAGENAETMEMAMVSEAENTEASGDDITGAVMEILDATGVIPESGDTIPTVQQALPEIVEDTAETLLETVQEAIVDLPGTEEAAIPEVTDAVEETLATLEEVIATPEAEAVEEVVADVTEQVEAVVEDVVEIADILPEIVAVATEEEGITALLDELGDVTEVLNTDLTDALDLLNGGGTDTAAEEPANDNETSWTESTIAEVGGLFDDIADGVTGTEDVLPDPVGTVAEGLGTLFQAPPPPTGGFLRGLFG